MQCARTTRSIARCSSIFIFFSEKIQAPTMTTRKCKSSTAPINAAEDLPHEAPWGLEDVWIVYVETVKQVGISYARRPFPDHPFWKRLANQPECFWRWHADGPFFGSICSPCSAETCIIDTLDAQQILLRHFKLNNPSEIWEVVCETCGNQVHLCCSNQLKHMKLSEIASDDFKFYCSNCRQD